MNKQLVSVAAVAAMAAGGALAVESQNIVGFDSALTSVQGFNFLAMPFNQVGYNTADINNLAIIGDGVGYGGENFSLWAGAPAGVVGSDCTYWDNFDGTFYWENSSTSEAEFSIDPGQGFVIQCAADDLVFRFNGQVSDEDAEQTTVAGFNFYGNPFADTIDIQDISIEGEGVGYGGENFSLWAGAPAGVVGSDCTYWDDFAGGFYWENASTGETEFPIEPGQGFVLQAAAADLTVTIRSPYSL